MTKLLIDRSTAEQALHVAEGAGYPLALIAALKAALAEPVQTQQENAMPITDDNGEAMRPQYRVIEQRGNWYLLYDQRQVGDSVRHEFRIQKLRHDIALYHGITLAEAQKRFHEKVEADHE